MNFLNAFKNLLKFFCGVKKGEFLFIFEVQILYYIQNELKIIVFVSFLYFNIFLLTFIIYTFKFMLNIKIKL